MSMRYDSVGSINSTHTYMSTYPFFPKKNLRCVLPGKTKRRKESDDVGSSVVMYYCWSMSGIILLLRYYYTCGNVLLLGPVAQWYSVGMGTTAVVCVAL